MSSASLILGILVLFPAFSKVWGDGCTGIPPFDLPVINMCNHTSVTLGRVHLSVTTATMGNNTRCNCTLRSKTPGSNTTTFLYLKATDSSGSKCNQSLIHITPFDRVLEYYVQTFTCTSPIYSASYTGITSSNVTITLTRPDTSVGVSYCVLVQPDRYLDGDLELSCESGRMLSPSTPTPSSTLPPTTSSSSTRSSSSSGPTPLATSRMMSSSQSPTSPSTSLTPTTQPQGQSVGTQIPSTATTENGQNSITAGALAGIVLGAIALICLTVIVIVISIIYIRYRTKLLSSRQNGTDNSAYTSLSDVTRVNPRADPNYAIIQSEGSSSQPGGNDATSGTGVYESVEGASSATRDDSQTGSGTYYNA